MVYKINKKISRILMLLLAFVFISNSLIIPKAMADEGYSDNIFGTKQDVPIDKVWRVRFNREIEESSANSNNVEIYDYGNNRKMPVDVSLGIDKHYITIQLKSGTYDGIHYDGKYEYGKKYKLTISKNITSKATTKEKKKNMPHDLTMDFITRLENPYPGIPAENGTVIMKDKAYSIEYLEKNSQLANDIIKNGKYVAYYIYSKDGERIKKLLGDEAIKDDPNSERVKEITYYNGDGYQQIYKWNETEGEYRLVPAAVFADITPGSKSGIVNVNAKSVNAVPGAIYYKLKHSNSIKKIGETTTFISSYPLEEISILSSNETVLAKGVLDVSKDNSKYYNLMTITETLGTTAGNSNNNGSFVMNSDLDTIYRNTGDKKTMYKKDLTGSIDHQISLDNAQYINTLGQWIYYSNYSDGAKIYKVKQDGTSRQKICDDKATYITVSGNQIFYSNHSDKGRLYVINTDSTGGTVDSAGNIHGRPVATSTGSYDTSAYDEVSYINLLGDWIYYSNVSDKHKIYVVNKDGTARRKVNDEWSDCVQVVGDWIYYASATGVLSKVRKDGTGIVIPIRAKTTEVDKGYHLNVVGDWLYYSNAEDGGKLYKIKTDGSGKKYKLADLKTEYINVVGDYLYIVTGGQSKTYMLPIDTDGRVAPKLIGKNSLDDKIVKVDNIKKFVDYADVSLPIKTLEVKYLPPKVPALMSDDTYKEVTVSWDTNNAKYKDGVYTYTGTILGYGQKVILDLNIPSEMLNDTNKIIVNNNAGPNDTVEVIGTLDGNRSGNSVRLKAGDLISVYSDKDCTKLLGKGTVEADKNALISKLNIDSDGSSFYLTVKRTGKGESKPTEIKQLESPIINGEIEDNDDIGIGLDGRDFSISKWIQGKFAKNTNYDGYSIVSQEIYILPGGNQLDMRSHNAIASSKSYDKNLTLNSVSWAGTKEMYIKKDSKGADFKDGKYDVFVSTGYLGSASPDSSGFKPVVEGNISSAAPKQVTVLGEKVPDRPSIKDQTVAGGGRFVINKMPKDDEVIWLIPEEEEYKVKGWRTEDGTENPFKVLMYASKAISINKGEELIAPQGLDSSIANYRDRRYKVFFVNKVGASEPATSLITVDNKKPRLLEISGVSIAAGEELAVKSSEKGTAYLVGQGTNDNSIDSLETAVRTMNGLKISVDSNGNRFNSYDTQKLQNITLDTNSNNYKIVLVDEAGNVSGKQKDVTIWRSSVDSELYPVITKARAALDYLNGIDIKDISTVEKAVKNNLPSLIISAEKVYNDKNASEKNIQDAMIKILEQTGNITSITGYENDKKQAKLKSSIQAIKLNSIVRPKDVIKLNTISGITTTVEILPNQEDVVQLDPVTNTIKLKDNSKLPTEMKVCKVKVTLKDTAIPALTEEKEFYIVVKGDNPVKELSLIPEGDNYIDINGGKLLVKAVVKGINEKLPVDFENITFEVREVDNSGKSITNGVDIDKDYGILTAKKNGKAYVKATIKNNDGTIITSTEMEIVITNQMVDLQNTVFTLNRDSSGKGILTIKNLPENNDISIKIYKTTNNDPIFEATPATTTNITRNNTSVVIRNLNLDNESLLRVELTKPNMNDPESVTVPVPR